MKITINLDKKQLKDNMVNMAHNASSKALNGCNAILAFFGVSVKGE